MSKWNLKHVIVLVLNVVIFRFVVFVIKELTEY
jgi:hypothetical protein